VHAQDIVLPKQFYYLEASDEGRWVLGLFTLRTQDIYELTILSQQSTNKDLLRFSTREGPLLCAVFGGIRSKVLSSTGPYAFHHNIIFVECGNGLHPSHSTWCRYKGSRSRWNYFDGYKYIDRIHQAELAELCRYQYRFARLGVATKEIHNSWMFVVSCRLGTGADKFKIGFDQYPRTEARDSTAVCELLSKPVLTSSKYE